MNEVIKTMNEGITKTNLKKNRELTKTKLNQDDEEEEEEHNDKSNNKDEEDDALKETKSSFQTP